MDRGAGVRPVQGGGSLNSSGPAVPEDVEESALVQKLVAPSGPTAADQEEYTASVHAMFWTFLSRVLHRTWPNAEASCRRKRNRHSGDCR